MGEKKGGSVVTENPKLLKLCKDSEGGPLKFAWKTKTWGGGGRDRESHQKLLGGITSTGDRLNFTLSSPKTPPPPQVINSDRSLRFKNKVAIPRFYFQTDNKEGSFNFSLARGHDCYNSPQVKVRLVQNRGIVTK